MFIKSIEYYYYKIMERFRRIIKYRFKFDPFMLGKKYAGRKLLKKTSEISEKIIEMINSDAPFLIARLGANEEFVMAVFEFGVKSHYKKSFINFCDVAGFFPKNIELGSKYLDLQKECLGDIDMLAVWNQSAEPYFIKKYTELSMITAKYEYISPWVENEPWTCALKDKKVLVVSPFADSIERQYKNRKKIYQDERMLPQFDLITYKAIQTAGDSTDDRFHNWFEALEYMKKDILMLDFEIAIVGCGAYAFPLGAELKKNGKKVIILAGTTQLLFGIMGKRWEKDPIISKYVNEYWIRPDKNEIPKGVEKIEGATYW